MTTIFIDPVDQEPDVPKPEDRQPCTRQDCPGEEGWHRGYGMAGGGIGAYLYCGTCEQVIEKSQDPDNEER